MGTTYNIKILDSEEKLNESELKHLVTTALENLNKVYSTYIPDSEISILNQGLVKTWLPISNELCHLLGTAQTISDLSDGRFDVTVGPLVNLWGFGPDEKSSKPSVDEITNALNKVGYHNLKLNCADNFIYKEDDVYVDLSAIAKGHATQVLAEKLSAIGANDVMVEIGGELTILGNNAEGLPWRIAIEKPTVDHVGAAQVLSLSDVSIATSGDYRNYYEVDGKRVSHTIDPLTGSPITHNLASVTVITENGGLADGWATALNVLGENKAFALAQKLNLAAYFIVRENDGFSVEYTNAFIPYMVKK